MGIFDALFGGAPDAGDMTKPLTAAIGKAGQMQAMMAKTPGAMQILEEALGVASYGKEVMSRGGLVQSATQGSALSMSVADRFRSGNLLKRPENTTEAYRKAQEKGWQAKIGALGTGAGIATTALGTALGASTAMSIAPLMGSAIQGAYGVQAGYQAQQGAMMGGIGGLALGAAGIWG